MNIRISTMKLGWLGYCSFLLFTLAVSAEMPSTSKDKSGLQALTEASNRFAIALYQAARNAYKWNVLVSPICLQFALALTYIGTRGNSAEEIARVLGFPKDEQEFLTSQEQLMQELQNDSENPVFMSKYDIFADNRELFLEEFRTKAMQYFNQMVLLSNFSSEADSSQMINTKMEAATRGRIRNLLAPGSVTADDSVVLINAAYFKDKWLHEFSPNLTSNMPFYVTESTQVVVPMMSQTGRFGYMSHIRLGAQILEMPYADSEFRMVIILPFDRNELPHFGGKLMTMNFLEIFQNLSQTEVEVTLPRFKIGGTLDVKNILKSLGIKSIFYEKEADFSGMRLAPLVVSNVFQGVFIEVNEEGTEAAAATGILSITRSVPARITLNRPFIYVIFNVKCSCILFIGEINKF